MGNALVVRKSLLPKSQKGTRAAQYVRMSTDYQRYSIENQAVVIGAYAQARNLAIVQTYRDDGESGLKLKNRAGLRQLLDDVQSGRADFDYILLKRVMAAEYSRELSVKVHAGACRFASMGFKSGGPTPYGLQRVLVDEQLQPKGILKKGDRKYIQTDHVRLQPGDAKEVTVVRWIFRRFLDVKSEKALARELTRHGIPPCSGARWTGPKITRILKNENYVGNIIYNRRSAKLRGNRVYNPPDKWIRSDGCVEPIVAFDNFLAARKIIVERRVDGLTEEEMLARLRRTLQKVGRLSAKIVSKTVGLPSHHVYSAHFGSMRNVYRLIGYTTKRNYEYLDHHQGWLDRLFQLQSQITTKFEKVGGHAVPNDLSDGLRVNGVVNVYFRVARLERADLEHYSPRWMIQRRHLPDGWIIAIRLADRSKTVLDYLLVPTFRTDSNTIRFSEKRRAGLGIVSFKTPEALAQSLIRRVTRLTRVLPTKREPPNKRSRSNKPKRVTGRARH